MKDIREEQREEIKYLREVYFGHSQTGFEFEEKLQALVLKSKREAVMGFANYVAKMISPQVGELFKKKAEEYLEGKIGLYELERLSTELNGSERKE